VSGTACESRKFRFKHSIPKKSHVIIDLRGEEICPQISHYCKPLPAYRGSLLLKDQEKPPRY
jgi:hypothetical protein